MYTYSSVSMHVHVCKHYYVCITGMENTADSLSAGNRVDVADTSIIDKKIRNQEELELEVKCRNGSTISDTTINNKRTEQRHSSVQNGLISSLIGDNYIDKGITAFKLCCLILFVVAVNLAPIILYFTDQSDRNIEAISGIADFKSCSVSCDSSFLSHQS